MVGCGGIKKFGGAAVAVTVRNHSKCSLESPKRWGFRRLTGTPILRFIGKTPSRLG
jgi:hypothetical protein